MERNKCKTCGWFELNDIQAHWQDRNQLGQCHRYPKYKQKAHCDWCGEYQAKVKQKKVKDPVNAMFRRMRRTNFGGRWRC